MIDCYKENHFYGNKKKLFLNFCYLSSIYAFNSWYFLFSNDEVVKTEIEWRKGEVNEQKSQEETKKMRGVR